MITAALVSSCLLALGAADPILTERVYCTINDATVTVGGQAANVLLPESGPKLLDAEIAHVGDPAFDLGQLFAHLLLPAVARGRPGDAHPALAAAARSYTEASGAGAAVLSNAARYAGVELLRRTIGAARVPAVEGETAALAVLDEGVRLVREARLPLVVEP